MIVVLGLAGPGSSECFAAWGGVANGFDKPSKRGARVIDQLVSALPRDEQHSFDPDAAFGVSEIASALDALLARFLANDVIDGMRDLRDFLRGVRAAVPRDRWLTIAAEIVMRHPIAELTLGCPVTRRSFEKPRGYPGDAPLLDLIYGVGEGLQTPHPATIAGQVHFYVVHSTACRAVRWRRQIIAAEIAKVAAAVNGASILSVACGHLREVELLAPATIGAIGEFHALDQDAHSLEVVRRSYGSKTPVRTVDGSVKSIIRGRTAFTNLDFVYSAGLFDYLAPPIAMRLIERLFGFLKPGGRLLVANFTPAVEDVGYMETFMDWRLIYRTPEELRALFADLPASDATGFSEFEDERGAVAYAVVEKAKR